MSEKTFQTQCCISGGGPAGIMLGFLLAKQGVEVIVLEKWPDFFRDFRGDTIHPSTMEFLAEIDLLDEFLKLPHQKTHKLVGSVGKEKITIADFSHLKVKAPYIAFIPQWDFLNFISTQAKKYSGFKLLMETEVKDLIIENNKVVGVKAESNNEKIEICADLVIGADGRDSIVRDKSGLLVKNDSVPIDVLWFSLPKAKSDSDQTTGYINAGKFMAMLERGDYWQCGYVIPKGLYEELKDKEIAAFRESIKSFVPVDDTQLAAIKSWDDVKLLSVTVNHMPKWYREGLLCIGDAAHAMSPIGGVGINLAIQDAIAAARILGEAFNSGKVIQGDLKKVQDRRKFPARLIQRIQVLLQNKVIFNVLKSEYISKPAFPFTLLQVFPVLQRIPAYLIGIGLRPESMKSGASS